MLVYDALVASSPEASASGITPQDPEEWILAFRTWAESHSDLPVLFDEAISRDFIYAGRGI